MLGNLSRIPGFSILDRYIFVELLLPFLFGMGLFTSLGVAIGTLFDSFSNANRTKVVADILEANPSTKYDCSQDFTARLLKFTENNLDKLHGYRLIDHRNGNSIHSWELGIKGECNDLEIEFMNELIANNVNFPLTLLSN